MLAATPLTPSALGTVLASRLGAPVSVGAAGDIRLDFGARALSVFFEGRDGEASVCIPTYDAAGDLVSLHTSPRRSDIEALVGDVLRFVADHDRIAMPRYGATHAILKAVAAMIDNEIGMEPTATSERDLHGHAGFEVDVVVFSQDIAPGLSVIVAEHGAWVCDGGVDGPARDHGSVGHLVEDFRALWLDRRMSASFI